MLGQSCAKLRTKFDLLGSGCFTLTCLSFRFGFAWWFMYIRQCCRPPVSSKVANGTLQFDLGTIPGRLGQLGLGRLI